jgi:hypothetical protein
MIDATQFEDRASGSRGTHEGESFYEKAAPVHRYLRIVADRLLFVLVAHKGDSNPGRSI